jgi:hypothetical protein
MPAPLGIQDGLESVEFRKSESSLILCRLLKIETIGNKGTTTTYLDFGLEHNNSVQPLSNMTKGMNISPHGPF